MLIGYARVSSQGQSLDRQIGALNTAKADKIFREVASGRTVKGRPQLERAIDALGAGDMVNGGFGPFVSFDTKGRQSQMLRHAHFYIKGGLRTFAAPAN
jgi:hypothetical protein